jgi:hypothetical protein
LDTPSILKGAHLSVNGVRSSSDLFHDRMEKIWGWIGDTIRTGPSKRMIMSRSSALIGKEFPVAGPVKPIFRDLLDPHYMPAEALYGIQSDFWFRTGGVKEKVPSMNRTLKRFHSRVDPSPAMAGTFKKTLPELLLKRNWSVLDLTPYRDSTVFGLGPYRGVPKDAPLWRPAAA